MNLLTFPGITIYLLNIQDTKLEDFINYADQISHNPIPLHLSILIKRNAKKFF